MHDLNRGDFVVEESAWKTANSMLDVHTCIVAVHALCEISLEVGRAVLVGVDLEDGLDKVNRYGRC
jgi:hypothetical protein